MSITQDVSWIQRLYIINLHGDCRAADTFWKCTWAISIGIITACILPLVIPRTLGFTFETRLDWWRFFSGFPEAVMKVAICTLRLCALSIAMVPCNTNILKVHSLHGRYLNICAHCVLFMQWMQQQRTLISMSCRYFSPSRIRTMLPLILMTSFVSTAIEIVAISCVIFPRSWFMWRLIW